MTRNCIQEAKTTVTWKCGTWYSPSSTIIRTIRIRRFRNRTSIPEWGLNAWLLSFKTFQQTTIQIFSRRLLRKRKKFQARNTAKTGMLIWHSKLLLTMSVQSHLQSETERFRPMKDAD